MGQKVHGKREKEFSKANKYLDIANIFKRNIILTNTITTKAQKIFYTLIEEKWTYLIE